MSEGPTDCCGSAPCERTSPQGSATFGRISDELIRSIRPRRVLHAGCAPALLVKALRERGVEAWDSTGTLAEPLDDRYDLIICLNVLEHLPEAEVHAAVRNLTSATETLLFTSTPAFAWLELFAQHGFAPDIAFDASFIAPHAMLLRREPALPPEVMRLFSECISWRHAAVQTRSQVEYLEAQLAQEREYLATLGRLQEHLMHEAQDIRQSLRSRKSGVHTEQPGLEASSDSADRQCTDAELQVEIRQLSQEQANLRAHIARLDRRTTELDRSIQSVASRLQSILNSRIWQTLVSASGLLLRITGRKG